MIKKKSFLSIFLAFVMAMSSVTFAYGEEINEDTLLCTCETACEENAVNEGCEVCKEDVGLCTGAKEINENVLLCICETVCEENAINVKCEACKEDVSLCTGIKEENEKVNTINSDENDDVAFDRATGIIDSGFCGGEGDGTNLTWTLYSDGTLIISGTGKMMDYVRWDNDTPWYDNRTSITLVTMESGMTSIGNGAFYNCSNLTSVTIPDSVTSIGDAAFSFCGNLTSVTIPDSVTSIGNEAFSSCGSLTSIMIPDNVTSIGDAAFSWCYNLTSVTIPDSITSINDRTFEHCNSLTSIMIPDNITSIGDAAFSFCGNLTSITIPDSVTSINDRTFEYCSRLTSIMIPDSVTSIGDAAFNHCNSLTSITIPNSVTSIGSEAFSECNYLTSITIPNSVTSIGNEAFSSCGSLTSIMIPDSVTSIGNYMFQYCYNLTSVTIPNSVTSIGESAFYRCISLTSMTIPDSVTSIESMAFSSCGNLTSITIPNSVTLIGSEAFFSCGNLTDVYYAGSQEDWAKITIGYSNECLTSANIHYNITGSDNVDFSDGVAFLHSYDPATRIITFESGVSYTLSESADTSNIEQLLEKYVLVTMDKDNVLTVNSIEPVESYIGTVSAEGEHSLTIDGTNYPVKEDIALGIYLNQEVLYHVYNGTIVGITILEEKTGTFEEWNNTNKMVTIDGTEYPTNYMTDPSFLSDALQMIGKQIGYYVPKSGDYKPLLKGAFYRTVTGDFSHYDVFNDSIYVDGESYPVDSTVCSPDTNVLNGKKVFFLLKNGKVIHIAATDEIKAGLRAVVTPKKLNVTYQNQQLSARELEGKLTVYYSASYDLPEQYDAAAVYAACNFQPIKLDSVTWEGSSHLSFNKLDLSNATFNVGENRTAPVKITIDKAYSLENEMDTLVGTCTITATPVGGSQKISAHDTINIVVTNKTEQSEIPEDSREVKEKIKEANSELQKAKIPFILDPQKMKNLFGISRKKDLNRFQQEMFAVLVMTEIPEDTLQVKINKKVLDKFLGKWQPDVAVKQWMVPLTYEIATPEYGRMTVTFSCDILDTTYMGSRIGRKIDVSYEIKSSEKEIRNYPKTGFLGGGQSADISAFATAAYNVVESELKSAYNIAWGNSANEVADWLLDDTVKKILDAKDTTYKDEIWKLCTWPAKSVVNKCPTNVYVYDEVGVLCGAIENDFVTKANEDFSLYVEDGTKYIIGLEDGYTVKYVATDNGTMDVTVTEYAGYETPVRQIEHLNVPLSIDGFYTQNISDSIRPQVETYALTSNLQTVLPVDREKLLLLLNPADDEEQSGGNSSGGSSSSGGGSSQSSSSSSIKAPSNIKNGTITVRPKTAAKGDKITIIAIPDSGYELNSLTVTDKNGNEIKITDKGNGKYTFVMPSTKVFIEAEFSQIKGKGSSEPDEVLNPFIDVNERDWFYEAVMKAYAEKLMNGVSANAFSPKSPITRGMVVTVLYNMEGRPEPKNTISFLDVAKGKYYEEAVAWASENKIVSGYNTQTFKPEENITREQFVSILYRYAGYKGYDITTAGELNKYSDTDQISEYAVQAMKWAVGEGIVSGDNIGRLNPLGGTTRAEAASMIARFYNDKMK